MAQVAIAEFQKQIEAVRREAFTAGYASAMKEIRALTARPKPGTRAAASAGRAGGRSRRRPAALTLRPAGLRRGPRANGRAAHSAARTRRSAGGRAQRGTNAVLVAEVLKSAAPRALRQAEIRRALQDKGKTMSFPSIGYSLRQLAARNAAKQGSGKSWRYQKA